MIVTFKWKDGHADSRGHILHHYQHCYYIDFGDCYCVAPWSDIEHTWVDIEDFIAAQQEAKEKGLNSKKDIGMSWSEVKC
jgi:hypothetical protein